jgi:hypothetical protein
MTAERRLAKLEGALSPKAATLLSRQCLDRPLERR